MVKIKSDSSLQEVAAVVSTTLEAAGIAATLSGGGAVSIYSENEYMSKDLDFVTAAMKEDLIPALEPIGFVPASGRGGSQFIHPLIVWYVEFLPAPLSFGNEYRNPADCAVLNLKVGSIRIITPTDSVKDRLVATFSWNDQQSWDQAVLVASNQDIDWDGLEAWFLEEGESTESFNKFRKTVIAEDDK